VRRVTRNFKQLVQRRVASDAAFRTALLREGIDTMLAGNVDTGKAILRDYIKATIGFEKLGEATGTQPKSLIRMFGSRGNPQARNLFSVLGYLQKQAGLQLHVTRGPAYGKMPGPVITVRDVLRLLWEADSYPCIGNEDWTVAAGMEAAALAKAATAVASPDDPPEFGRWLGAL
jgi:hypothetical protein